MTKQKKIFLLFALVSAILVLFFIIAAILKMEILGNVLSMLITATATAILIYAYYISKSKNSTGRAIPFLALSCFSWFFADLLSLLTLVSGGNPQNSVLINSIYSFTSVFLYIAVLLFVIFLFKKWKSVQHLLDTFIITILSVMLVWIVFLQKDHAWINLFWQTGFNSAICIVLDFIIIIGTSITLYSIRNNKIPVFMLIYDCGILAFTVTDLFYYYFFAHSMYIPYSFLDVIYATSLIIISLGGLWRSLVDPVNQISIKKELGIGKRWLIFFLFPLVALLSEGFVYKDIIHFLVAIIMYRILTVQVQVAAEKDQLYRKELELNNILEKRVEEQYGELIFMANHDTVTKLNNRRFFIKSLEDTIEKLPKHQTLAVLFIDIDRFKTINDTLGHDIGDKVLIEISTRMLECVNDSAVLARLGGDEFAVFIWGNYTRQNIVEFAEKIIEICNNQILIDDNRIQITISLGIAFYPTDADNRGALMRNADIAMYRAKSQGYNKYVFYDPFFVESIGRKNEIEVMLRKANLEKDLELFYQPQYNLITNKLIGAEALLCWRSAEHGYIPHKEFITVAEEIDYIIRIGKWMLNEAARKIIEWNTRYSIDLKMGIKISPKQLHEDEFVNTMKNLINNENFKSTWIDAEISDPIFLESENKANNIFEVLKGLYVSVSVDDFGAGYRTLENLNEIPFDRIRIDKSLIDQLSETNTNGIQVVKALISMADAMGISAIAEGVENQEQLSILKKLKCRQAQGYWLGRPVPATDFEELFIINHKIS